MALVVLATVGAGVMVFAWTIDETHFERPDAEFDALAAQVAAVPGVKEVQHERWVEAPSFSDPSSSIAVTVDDAASAAVLDMACTGSYPGAVSWTINIDTAAGTRVTLVSDANHGCPPLGFDALPVVTEIDRLAPGIEMQASVWSPDRLTLAAFDGDTTRGFADLLPLVENADSIRNASSLDSDSVIEVSALTLAVEIRSGEGPAYSRLLSRLVDQYGVTGFFAEANGTLDGGVEDVHVAAPAQHHAEIENAIAGSGLSIADSLVTFVDEANTA